MTREAIAAELDAIGARRRAALDAADAELEAIVALLPAAIAAGLTIKEVARRGATTRPTLYARTGVRSPHKGGRPAAEPPA